MILCLYYVALEHVFTFWPSTSNKAVSHSRPEHYKSHVQVEGAFYSYASPTPTNTEPYTVAYSPGELGSSPFHPWIFTS